MFVNRLKDLTCPCGIRDHTHTAPGLRPCTQQAFAMGQEGLPQHGALRSASLGQAALTEEGENKDRGVRLGSTATGDVTVPPLSPDFRMAGSSKQRVKGAVGLRTRVEERPGCRAT